jgi:hypothetical protein
MKKVIEFDDIVGGQDGGVEELVAKGNPFHLKVTAVSLLRLRPY